MRTNLICLAFLFCLYGIVEAQTDEKKNDFFDKTADLIFIGKTDIAMLRIDSALTVNPRNVTAIRLKINIYQRSKNIEGIKKQVDILLAVDTVGKREYNVFRGVIEEYTNSYKAALPYYQKAKLVKVKPIPAKYKDVDPIFFDYLIDNDKRKLTTRLVELFGKEEWNNKFEFHWLVDFPRKEMLEVVLGIRHVEITKP